jgi:hypothetical protein
MNYIYKLDAVIDDIHIVTIGLFSSKDIAKQYRTKWEEFDGNGIKIECYLNKMIIDKVILDKTLTPGQMKKLKPLLRDYKLGEIGIK